MLNLKQYKRPSIYSIHVQKSFPVGERGGGKGDCQGREGTLQQNILTSKLGSMRRMYCSMG